MRRPDRPKPPYNPVIEESAPRPRARRRGPLRIDEGDPLFPGGAPAPGVKARAVPTPAEAPPPPPPRPTPRVYDDSEEPEPELGTAAVAAVKAAAASGGSRIGALFWGSIAALVGLGISVAAYDFVAGLVMRNPLLGTIAAALTAIVVGALAIFVLREVAATSRLGRVDSVRERATQAMLERDRTLAHEALQDLQKLYAKRRDMEWGLDRLKGRQDDLLDADTLLTEGERLTMEPLDRRAEEAVGKAARSVAMVTAMVPMALVDVMAALLINLRMIRNVAEVYGGRAGWLGSWRLLRAVAGHLIATGAVAIGEDMIGSVLGGGVLAKVSRRLGEGLINGALTARVGAAAIEVCRPLPFNALPRPSARALAAKALKGIVGGRGAKEKA